MYKRMTQYKNSRNTILQSKSKVYFSFSMISCWKVKFIHLKQVFSKNNWKNKIDIEVGRQQRNNVNK